MKKRSFFTYETGIGVIGGMTIALLIVFFIRIFSPILCSLAQEELQSRFNKICNEAVLEYFDDKKNSELFEIERLENGEIQGITTDTIGMNRIKSSLNLKIQKELDKIDEIKVEVPSGGFFGIGGSFKIPVYLLGITALETDYVSNFESVGINQTRISVEVSISLSGELVAFGQENAVTVKTTVPVLMTVIVGKVPGTYVEVKK